MSNLNTKEPDIVWYTTGKCPECGKFTSKRVMLINGLEEVKSCTGICNKHGKVNIDWDFL